MPTQPSNGNHLRSQNSGSPARSGLATRAGTPVLQIGRLQIMPAQSPWPIDAATTLCTSEGPDPRVRTRAFGVRPINLGHYLWAPAHEMGRLTFYRYKSDSQWGGRIILNCGSASQR